jgi:small subunit ribosomal protein S20
MANIKSAKKRARQAVSNRIQNMQIRSKVRTCIKKTDLAIEEKNTELAITCFKEAQSQIAKAARKGVFKANKSQRDISRLNTRLKNLTTANSEKKSETN